MQVLSIYWQRIPACKMPSNAKRSHAGKNILKIDDIFLDFYGLDAFSAIKADLFLLDTKVLTRENRAAEAYFYAIDKIFRMTRSELFVAAGLVFVIGFGFGFGFWVQAPVADEVDPVYLEAMAYSEKTPVHMESTKSIWACNDRRIGGPRQCELMTIGQATSEKGGAYGEQVKAAIEDTREHIRAWMADHPPETGGLHQDSL